MEFRDLKKQYQILKPQLDKAVTQVMASGAYILGDPVAQLETSLAQYVGVKHCITCANGTDALTLALKALGIGKGDVVFVPDFTFFASAEVIALEGAIPVFVDVDPQTFNISPASILAAIERIREDLSMRPRAIIAVDLFGLSANYAELRAIARQYNLFIVEDGAQGFGSSVSSPSRAQQRACSFGDISTTSFFPAKPLGCYGDGGAVFTDNDEWADVIRSLRLHGKGSNKYDNVRIGMNSRLDTLQAAILQVKFEAFVNHELSDVQRAAAYYTQLIEGTTRFSRKPIQILPPLLPKGYQSSWAQYTVRLVNADGTPIGAAERQCIQEKMKAKGIPTMVYYPTPMSQQTAFRQCHDYILTPNALALSQSVLSLPIHPYITREEIRTVIEALISSI